MKIVATSPSFSKNEKLQKEIYKYFPKAQLNLDGKKSPWVVGVLEYLQIYYKKQFFFVVTATPQKEIEDILEQLQIACYFKQVIGSPTKKMRL